MENLAFIILGPSGVGKETLLNYVLSERPSIIPTVSVTTRPKRENEVDGDHYHFVSPEEFERLIKEDKFIEYSHHFNAYYGTLKSEMTKSKYLALVIDINGVEILKKIKGINLVTIFITVSNPEILIERIKARGGHDNSLINERILNATERLNEELSYSAYCDHVIINDDLDQAKEDILKTIDKYLD